MNMEIKKPDKKSLQYLALILVVAILIGVGLVYILSLFSVPEIETDQGLIKEVKREKIVKQLQELNEQKEEIPPLPREEILKQLKELNK